MCLKDPFLLLESLATKTYTKTVVNFDLFLKNCRRCSHQGWGVPTTVRSRDVSEIQEQIAAMSRQLGQLAACMTECKRAEEIANAAAAMTGREVAE